MKQKNNQIGSAIRTIYYLDLTYLICEKETFIIIIILFWGGGGV